MLRIAWLSRMPGPKNPPNQTKSSQIKPADQVAGLWLALTHPHPDEMVSVGAHRVWREGTEGTKRTHGENLRHQGESNRIKPDQTEKGEISESMNEWRMTGQSNPARNAASG
jgi:hypothetical protein